MDTLVGGSVRAFVGFTEGIFVVGQFIGAFVLIVGLTESDIDGDVEVDLEGVELRDSVGGSVGAFVGLIEGKCVIGQSIGALVLIVGDVESKVDGDIESDVVGAGVSDSEGKFVGTVDDNTVGTSMGAVAIS